jgi:hypothetical protein
MEMAMRLTLGTMLGGLLVAAPILLVLGLL